MHDEPLEEGRPKQATDGVGLARGDALRAAIAWAAWERHRAKTHTQFTATLVSGYGFTDDSEPSAANTRELPPPTPVQKGVSPEEVIWQSRVIMFAKASDITAPEAEDELRATYRDYLRLLDAYMAAAPVTCTTRLPTRNRQWTNLLILLLDDCGWTYDEAWELLLRLHQSGCQNCSGIRNP